MVVWHLADKISVKGSHILVSFDPNCLVHFHNELSKCNQHLFYFSKTWLREFIPFDDFKYFSNALRGGLSWKFRLLLDLELERSFLFEVSVQ